MRQACRGPGGGAPSWRYPPRLATDDELGVAEASLSPGLRKMTARVGAASPFAKAADLLAELAGIRLSPKRIERAAEAAGAAAAARAGAESTAIGTGGCACCRRRWWCRSPR